LDQDDGGKMGQKIQYKMHQKMGLKMDWRMGQQMDHMVDLKMDKQWSWSHSTTSSKGEVASNCKADKNRENRGIDYSTI
jgi:hypothetical protein